MRKGIVYIAGILILCTVLLGVQLRLFDKTSISTHAQALSAQVSACCVYPFLRMQYFLVTPLKNWLEHKYTMQELEHKLAGACKECEELRAQHIAWQAQDAYMRDIKELVTFAKRYEQQAHVAHIMMKHMSDQAHYFLVDLGAQDGINQDMVAVYKNCLVGRVIEVYPWYSKVQLITDANCKVGASCAQSRALGIHRGMNVAEETRLHYVSHLDKVDVGDIILSSGEGLVFPQGFALGTITECVPDGLYQKVTATSLVNFKDLHYCILLSKGT